MQKPPDDAPDLHPALAVRLEALIGGAIHRATPVAGGYTPTRRLLCTTSRGRFFAKVGATPLTASFVRREIEIYNRISGALCRASSLRRITPPSRYSSLRTCRRAAGRRPGMQRL